MKHEWRKKEKEIYLPPRRPVVIDVPEFSFFSIHGHGNPNSDAFGQYVEALYGASYTIRMAHKKGLQPEGFYEYTVYPLEGVWDISEKAKEAYDGTLDKDELVFDLMIRQPDFVSCEYALEAVGRAKEKKSNPLLDQLEFGTLSEGRCVQMMHHGSFESEPESFRVMEEFCARNGLKRKSKVHREIYTSDPRKTAPDRLKTVLRFGIE